ncbi:hypothetical protein SELR_pSRC400970 (plasmid) [Selenomonas ruminantium subsp. lactilytica TAM6421]|uniref:Uncharacterized protein n=1 Tax=Selenomonas ruminantium subsp. lactilytica (strain NBRC 103574 / TAM6421) TaxID=927704 RepID=I0GVG1_SELRL|nr:hypothetical protein [Selenomonas ruminantium]BAL84748.1 hypothetical protein SELR_pSRC400970 [Selenomonas ruminantium subsp. lactilytica TAM6421]
MKTNLEEIRHTTKLLFNAVPIEENKALPGLGICSHPFTTSTISMNPQTGEVLDLTTPDGYKVYRKFMMELIDRSDVGHLYLLINRPYKMTWFKLCREYMSEKDYAKYLKQCWLDEEDPNQDINVSRKEAINFFRSASKKHLMEPADLEYYNNLPDTITIYRGVSPGRERYGLSWTDNREKAEWFKSRYENGKPGVLLTATVSRKYVLCYIDDRNEKELVVDVFKITDKIQEV